MRLTGLAVAVLLLAPFSASALHAQEPAAAPPQAPAAEAPAPGTPRSRADLVDEFMPGQDSSAEPPGQARFTLDSPDAATVEPATRGREQAAWRAYYDYKIRGLQHRSNTYQWQLASSKIIFVVVILLVFVGLYFSWLQFRLSLQPRPPAAVSTVAAGAAKPEEASGLAPAETAVVMAVTEISAGRDGIKVSSPVLGVIILVVSLLFFYLYLVYIYPISEML